MPLRFFFCRFLSECSAGLVLVWAVVRRPLYLDFSISKIQMGGTYGEVCTKKSIYMEMSYTDFCRRRQANQSYMNKMFIPVQGCLLEVMREQCTKPSNPVTGHCMRIMGKWIGKREGWFKFSFFQKRGKIVVSCRKYCYLRRDALWLLL